MYLKLLLACFSAQLQNLQPMVLKVATELEACYTTDLDPAKHITVYKLKEMGQ